MSELVKRLLKQKLPAEITSGEWEEQEAEDDSGAMVPPVATPRRNKARYSPSGWESYFGSCKDVAIDEDISFSHVVVYQSPSPTEGQAQGPLFVLHHGAGLGALSFAVMAKKMMDTAPGPCRILAYDSREHGETRTASSDLSLNVLAQDLVNIVHKLYGDQAGDIILVGHSMGGAVVTHVTSQSLLKNILGLVVIDVVEGSALDALSSMHSLIESRPKQFGDIEDAIEWSLSEENIRNDKSAKVSVPPLLVKMQEGPSTVYRWRTNLAKTEQYWTDWFTGLSEKFLSSRTAKFLVLAGTDRLDKTLMIGQMQGKFQMAVLPESGHSVQEDQPGLLAANLLQFWKRNERLVLPPKVPIPPKKDA